MSDKHPIFAPDLDKIFNDLEFSEQCSTLACNRVITVGRHNTPVCDGSAMECPRTTLIANEVRQCIMENDDLMQYIMTI